MLMGSIADALYRFHQMVFEIEGFSIKMEGMFGGQMIPLLSIDGSMQGEVKNWSSAVSRIQHSNTSAPVFHAGASFEISFRS